MRENRCRINIENEHEAPNPPGWLITFNDLITLLMVFFVLLFAMGNINTQKSQKLVGSIQDAGVLLEGRKVGVKIVRPIQSTEPATQEVSGDSSSTVSQLSEVSRNAIDDLANNPEITVIKTPKGLFITLSDGILFQSGLSELRPEGYPVLNKIIQVLQQSNGLDVRIEGHTDNVAIRSGRFSSNWDLSIVRAVHVVKYFIDAGKIAPQRLSAVGYGESKPLYPNDSPANREKNRRVEIILELMDS